jgi:hypothetical protein
MHVMANTFTERIRLSAADERLLRRLAKERKTTKSDILRAGLKLVAGEDERERRRREGIAGLIRLAREVPGKDIPWGAK